MAVSSGMRAQLTQAARRWIAATDYPLARRMSLNTPAAVSAGPAPGPAILKGTGS
jgi:hypothetical protein